MAQTRPHPQARFDASQAQAHPSTADQALAATLTDCLKASRHIYGTPRLRGDLREDLRDLSHHIGRRRIARLMKSEGWLYLAAEMDLCSHRIVGWEAGGNMERGLVIDAFENAIAGSSGRPCGLIHHRDQGSQYTSRDFTAKLHSIGIQRSMSRRGNCYDNAAMESFWSTLKAECFDREVPATHAQARSMIFDYIETFYNATRRRSSLGYRSPLQYEQQIHPKA